MFLPWYAVVTVVRQDDRRIVTQTVPKSALFVFSWVEAAVLLVCVAVLALLLARAERRPFHLPGGDGLVLALAGAWASLLIVWRLFDRPEPGRGVPVGVAWGIFVALAAAGALVYAGLRVRAAHPPEPPPRRRPPRPQERSETVLGDERPHLDETQVLNGGDAATRVPPGARPPEDDAPAQS
jgi:hypothetical protein